MRWVLGCVAAAALTVGAGCGSGGGDGDDGLARGALAKEADAICARASDAGNKIPTPDDGGDLADLARVFTAAVPIAERQHRELVALKPADDVRKNYGAMLAADRRSLEVLRDLQRTTADGPEDAVVASLVKRAEAAERSLNAAADGLGALQCGSAGG